MTRNRPSQGSSRRSKPAPSPADQRPATPTPPLELALGVIGAVILVVLAGYILISAFTGTGSGYPDIRIVQSAPQPLQHGWLLPFQAINTGTAPATQLTIRAHVELGDGQSETSEVVIDYLAPRSSQRGGFFFTAEPREGAVEVRALGFIDP
jgi:uncharacterized protein (TIGR02588 family)